MNRGHLHRFVVCLLIHQGPSLLNGHEYFTSDSPYSRGLNASRHQNQNFHQRKGNVLSCIIYSTSVLLIFDFCIIFIQTHEIQRSSVTSLCYNTLCSPTLYSLLIIVIAVLDIVHVHLALYYVETWFSCNFFKRGCWSHLQILEQGSHKQPQMQCIMCHRSCLPVSMNKLCSSSSLQIEIRLACIWVLLVSPS